MLNNKNVKSLLFFLLSNSIVFGVKIDGFNKEEDRQLGIGEPFPINSVRVTDTELIGNVNRNALKIGYSFQDTASDPNQTLLHYSGSNTGTSKIAYTLDNDFDLNINPIFKLNFTNVNKDFTTKIILADLNGTQRTSSNIAVGISNLNLSIDLTQMGNFTDQIDNPFNISQVRSFQFIMNANPTSKVIFDLDSIEAVPEEAVPEPFSMISLGLGVAGLVKKRKKNLFKNTI